MCRSSVVSSVAVEVDSPEPIHLGIKKTGADVKIGAPRIHGYGRVVGFDSSYDSALDINIYNPFGAGDFPLNDHSRISLQDLANHGLGHALLNFRGKKGKPRLFQKVAAKLFNDLFHIFLIPDFLHDEFLIFLRLPDGLDQKLSCFGPH